MSFAACCFSTEKKSRTESDLRVPEFGVDSGCRSGCCDIFFFVHVNYILSRCAAFCCCSFVSLRRLTYLKGLALTSFIFFCVHDFFRCPVLMPDATCFYFSRRGVDFFCWFHTVLNTPGC